mmetsp:Transcript_5974/g.19494  ORF Transcript_5974/g.19494 Transcript_5974/m.19494 type:complete len:217 (-) Transcript_5974:3065-3715(-)
MRFLSALNWFDLASWLALDRLSTSAIFDAKRSFRLFSSSSCRFFKAASASPCFFFSWSTALLTFFWKRRTCACSASATSSLAVSRCCGRFSRANVDRRNVLDSTSLACCSLSAAPSMPAFFSISPSALSPSSSSSSARDDLADDAVRSDLAIDLTWSASAPESSAPVSRVMVSGSATPPVPGTSRVAGVAGAGAAGLSSAGAVSASDAAGAAPSSA